MRRQTAKEIREFAKSNPEKGRGTIAGGWVRWAEEVLNPKVDWRKTLGAQVRNALASTRGMANHSYSRLSRRQSSVPDVVMPGWVRPVPKVKIVVDTSGSMGGDDLQRAVAEVGGILKTAGVADDEVEVISTDAQVHSQRKVRNAKQIELKGGGGTDMRVGIDAALSGPERPNVVVVMTDGYTPWPDRPPPKGTKIIACIISPDGSAGADSDTIAGFGIPSFIKTVAVSH